MELITENIPWASRQIWAPDADYKNGKYYLNFSLRDKKCFFKFGVAISDMLERPFQAEKDLINGSCID